MFPSQTFLTSNQSRFWNLLCLSLIYINAFAQSPSFNNYTTKDGLPSNTIYELQVDKDGYLWIATNYGISKFDGNSFQTFDKNDGLSDNEIFGFFTDSQNRMWLRTFNGSFCYYKDGSIYTQPDIAFKNIIPIRGIIREITEDKNGNIFFCSSFHQILKLDKDLNFTETLKGSFTNSLLRDKNKNVILVAKEPNKDYTYLNPDTNEEIILNVEDLDIDMNHFVSLMDQETKNEFISKYYDIKLNPKNAYNIIKHQDIYWKYSPHLKLVQSKSISKKLTIQNELSFLYVNKSIIDNEGNLWFCTLKNGLYKLNHQIKYNVNIESIQSKDKFTTMSKKDSSILVGTSGGDIYEINNKKIDLRIKSKPPATIQGHYNLSIKKILKSNDGNYYIGKDYGIYKYDNKFNLLQNKLLTLKDINLYKKNLLISTSNSSTLFSKDNLEAGDQIYNSRSTTNFIDRNSNIWLGSQRGLLMYHPNERDYWIPKDTLLNSITVNDINETEDGLILIATNGDGLIVLNKERKLIKQITSSDQLSHDVINHILVDKNEVWLSTNSGVTLIKINIDQSFNIRSYKSNLGLESNTVIQTEISNDILYVLTSENVTAVSLSKLNNLQNRNSNIQLDKVYVNGKEVLEEKLNNLKHYENELEVQYTSISINHSDEIAFRYRLDGNSKDWKYTKERKIKFEGLGPNKYQLQIQPSIPGIEKTSDKAMITIPITIRPVWYKRNWVRLLAFLSAFTLIYYLVKSSLKKQKLKLTQELEISKLKQKALMMEMNPHFINNCLSSIQNFVLTGDRREASDYLSKFAKLIRVIISDSRNNEVTLHQEIQHLQLYLDLEKLRFSNKFSYTITTNIKSKDNILIPTMMVQPLVENVIMHAFDFTTPQEKKLEIIFTKEDNYLICNVIDNGIGLSKSAKTTNQYSSGIAIDNIKKRINHIVNEYPLSNFTIEEYENINTSGTKATLTFPINKNTTND